MKTLNSETVNRCITALAAVLPGADVFATEPELSAVGLAVPGVEVYFEDCIGEAWSFCVYLEPEAGEFMFEAVMLSELCPEVTPAPSLKEALALLVARHFELVNNF